MKIRNKMFPDFIKGFDDLEEAKEAVYQALLDRTRGFKGDRSSADKVKVADLFEAEIELIRRGVRVWTDPKPDMDRLQCFIRDEFIADYSLSNLKREHWEDYRPLQIQ